MILALAALALAAAPPPSRCSLAHVDRCLAMWDLLDRRDFRRELRRFLGAGRASWTIPDEDKTEQVLTTLQVSGENPVRLPDGMFRLGGCFPHDCPERAQVFFAPGGAIRAVALLYHDCGGRTCTGHEDYTLRILVRERSPQVEGHARHWAEEDLRADDRRFPEFGPSRLGNSVVELLKG